MKTVLSIGLIGDSLAEFHRPQQAMIEMIERAGEELNIDAEVKWFPTPELDTENIKLQLEPMDALWCTPGSPYLNLKGALNGIRFAREHNYPFIGTCAGFQHTVLEYARNVMGISNAASSQYEPDAADLLIKPLVCPIAKQMLQIDLLPGSRTNQVYNKTEIQEYYYCRFGLNPDFQQAIAESGLKITGTDQTGEARVLELPEHRFFISTLFVPGASYTEGLIEMKGAHPLIKALLQSGLSFQKEKAGKGNERFITISKENVAGDFGRTDYIDKEGKNLPV